MIGFTLVKPMQKAGHDILKCRRMRMKMFTGMGLGLRMTGLHKAGRRPMHAACHGPRKLLHCVRQLDDLRKGRASGS
jgi:hypothetical protein